MPPAKKDRFPILSLSSLPSECIAKQLSCSDVFLFSTISKDCFDMMKDGLRSTPNRRRMTLDLEGDKHQLNMYCTGVSCGKSETLEWQFNGTLNRRRRWNVELYTEFPPKTLVFREKSKGRYVTASNSVEEVLQLAEHLGNLFRAFTNHITISTENCRFLPAIQPVPVVRQAGEIRVSYGILSHDAMLRLLSGFQSKSLWISCGVEPNFEFNGPILTEQLSIFKSSWFTAPLFHAFNGTRLVLHDSGLTNADLNTFLRNWKAGQLGRMTYLSFHKTWNRVGFGNIDPEFQRRWDEEKWDVAKIAEGLEDIRHVPAHPMENSESMYKRQTDGMELLLHITSVHFTGMMSMTFCY